MDCRCCWMSLPADEAEDAVLPVEATDSRSSALSERDRDGRRRLLAGSCCCCCWAVPLPEIVGRLAVVVEELLTAGICSGCCWWLAGMSSPVPRRRSFEPSIGMASWPAG